MIMMSLFSANIHVVDRILALCSVSYEEKVQFKREDRQTPDLTLYHKTQSCTQVPWWDWHESHCFFFQILKLLIQLLPKRNWPFSFG